MYRYYLPNIDVRSESVCESSRLSDCLPSEESANANGLERSRDAKRWPSENRRKRESESASLFLTCSGERNDSEAGSMWTERLVPTVWHRVCQPVSHSAANAALRFCFLNIPTELSRLPSITSTTDHDARLATIGTERFVPPRSGDDLLQRLSIRLSPSRRAVLRFHRSFDAVRIKFPSTGHAREFVGT